MRRGPCWYSTLTRSNHCCFQGQSFKRRSSYSRDLEATLAALPSLLEAVCKERFGPLREGREQLHSMCTVLFPGGLTPLCTQPLIPSCDLSQEYERMRKPGGCPGSRRVPWPELRERFLIFQLKNSTTSMRVMVGGNHERDPRVPRKFTDRAGGDSQLDRHVHRMVRFLPVRNRSRLSLRPTILLSETFSAGGPVVCLRHILGRFCCTSCWWHRFWSFRR